VWIRLGRFTWKVNSYLTAEPEKTSGIPQFSPRLRVERVYRLIKGERSWLQFSSRYNEYIHAPEEK
jgi:hypothetical protein